MTNSKQTEALREALTSVPDWASEAKEQPAPVAKPRKQEPVAYAVYHRMGGSKSLHWSEQHSPDGDSNEYQLLPLYTSPQAQPAQRKPLTDEQWQSIADTLGCIITRSQKDAIEATIGIKGDA